MAAAARARPSSVAALVAFGLVAAFALAGCATDDECPAVALEAGGADMAGSGFIAWPGVDASAQIACGFQGGTHLWVSARFQRPFTAGERMRFGVRSVDATTGALTAPGQTALACRPTKQADGWWHCDGLFHFIARPCLVAGRALRVQVSMYPEDGCTAAATAIVTPVWQGDCTDPEVSWCDPGQGG